MSGPARDAIDEREFWQSLLLLFQAIDKHDAKARAPVEPSKPVRKQRRPKLRLAYSEWKTKGADL